MSDTFLKRKNLYPALAAGLAAVYLLTGIIPLATDFKPANDQTSPVTDAESISDPASVTGQPAPDFSQISGWHLFGQSATPMSAEDAPAESQSQLKLLGIFHLSKYRQYANTIIESADQIQKTYRINDELPGGAILQAIEQDKIILLADNRREFLMVQKYNPESQPAGEDTSLPSQ